MTTSVVTVKPSDTLSHACSLMTRENISCVVVVEEANDAKPIGVLTERGIVNFITEHPVDRLCDCFIAEFIGSKVHSLNYRDSLLDAIRMCQKHAVRHIIITNDNGDLAGVISFTDIVEQVMADSVQNLALLDGEQSTGDSVNEVMRRLAFTDPMMGISNRRAMDLDLEHQWEVALRYERTFSLAMLDVDYFKNYNDRYGHLAGDKILTQIAQTIDDSTRASDKIYRFGGEEFCLILPETSSEHAIALVKRIVVAISELNIPHDESPYGIVTLSGGVSELNPTNRIDKDELLNNADRALYDAKTVGRNTACLSADLRKAS